MHPITRNGIYLVDPHRTASTDAMAPISSAEDTAGPATRRNTHSSKGGHPAML